MKVWIDGKLHDKENAKISVFDHCLLYGDGVFEGIRLYDGCIFRLREHLERLWSSARYLCLHIPMTLDEMRDVVVETVRANQLRDGYIRLLVTRGEGDLGLNPLICPKPSVIVIAANITLYPAEFYEKGLEIITVPTARVNTSAWNPRAKTCNYLNNIMAKIEAQSAGALEALMLDSNGYVVECTGDNIFLVKNKELITPPVYLGALRGITRDAIIEIAGKLGHTVKEEPFTRFEVFDADEAFLTGTAAEAIPVVKVDSRVIGNGKPGPVTRRLIEEFRKVVKTDGDKVCC
jgi:branched-chain amino acid aminotransferase